MTATTLLFIFISILLIAVVLLFVWIIRLREEITDFKYIIAEKDSKGNIKLKNHKGETIFEL